MNPKDEHITETKKNKEPMTKEQKNNVILMIILIILFLIGIITRWGYIKTEISDSVNHFFPSKDSLYKR